MQQGNNPSQEDRYTNADEEKVKKVYDCPICEDAGGKFVTKIKYNQAFRREDPYQFWELCSCLKQKALTKRFEFSAITPIMQEVSFDKFKTTGVAQCVVEAYKLSKDYLKSFLDNYSKRDNSIFLGGEPGSGKTTLLFSIANELIREGVNVIYFPWVEGLDELKDGMRSESKDYLDKVHQLQTVQLLFIDDLFKSKAWTDDRGKKKRSEPTPYEIKFLQSVINYRYLNHLPIMVSSELTMEQILFWDLGIGSRIFEMSGNNVVHLVGEPDLNYRLPKGFKLLK